MRTFDATSGTFLGIDRKGIPDYKEGFTKYWKSTVSLLNIPWRDRPNLVNAEKAGLPSHILEALRKQAGLV